MCLEQEMYAFPQLSSCASKQFDVYGLYFIIQLMNFFP